MRFALLLVTLVITPNTFAWGEDGHQIICQIAYDRLSEEARAFVDDTLRMGVDLDGNGDTDFAKACLWPDSARYNDYKGSYEQHYINVSKYAQEIDLGRDCAALDCIAVGLQRQLKYLARGAEGKRERARKAAALRFVGHFAADLHQPLHVGHSEDWGGNKIAVSWFGTATNLHAVWDREITARAGLRYPDSVALVAAEETEFLSRNVLRWMKQSFRLARSHAYAGVDGKPLSPGAELGDAYFERNRPLVQNQLALAARRLAFLLEGIAEGSLETNILIE